MHYSTVLNTVRSWQASSLLLLAENMAYYLRHNMQYTTILSRPEYPEYRTRK